MEQGDKVDNTGHRERMRQRFMKTGIRTLHDYEILEMLLFMVYARKDTKPLAKSLLKQFKSLKEIILGDVNELRKIKGVGEGLIFFVMLLQDLFSRLFLASEQGSNVHILSNWNSVINYLQLTMGFQKREFFRVLYLNNNNMLIYDKLFDSGTVNKVVVFPREIAKDALFYNATAVVIAHNHPGGDSKPSVQDVHVTQEIKAALKTLGIDLHDHIVISEQNHFSFRSNNII